MIVLILAGYMMLQAGVFGNGLTIDITLKFRTQQANGLLMFAFGGTGSYLLVQLVNSTLNWVVTQNGAVKSVSFTAVQVCDGQWHTAQLSSRAVHEGSISQMRITVDNILSSGNPHISSVDVLTSYLYIGGVPANDVEALTFIRGNGLTAAIQNSKDFLTII